MGKDDYIDVRVRMKDSRKFLADAKAAGAGVETLGKKGDGAGAAMGRASAKAGLFRRGLGALATTAKVGAFAIGAVLGGAIYKSLTNFAEAEKVTAGVNAVITSTGGIANVTAKRVGALADSIALKTGIDDEAIANGERLLLTFTNIRNETGKGNKIFDQATMAATNLSVAFGKDMAASAIMVGKALQDPTKGVSALGRVGIKFTSAQEEQIKAMQKSGNLLGAQKLILKEVNVQSRGAAEAYGKTFAGSLDRAKVMVGNLSEWLGGKLAPSVKKGIDFVGRFARILQTQLAKGVNPVDALRKSLIAMFGPNQRMLTVFDGIRATVPKVWSLIKQGGKVVGQLVGKVIDFVTWLNKGSEGAETFKAAAAGLLAGIVAYKVVIGITKAWAAAQTALNIAMSLNPIGLIIAAIVGLGVAFVLAYKKVEWFRNGVNAAVGFIGKHWKILFVLITGPIGLAVLLIVKYKDKIVGAFKAAVGFIRNNWKLILAILTGPIGLAVLFISKNLDRIVGFFRGMGGKIKGATKGMWNGVKDSFKDAINWVIRKWNDLSFGMEAKKIKGKTVVPGFRVNTPNIPELYRGGMAIGAGSALVGERGPEVVNLPTGASVIPLPRTDAPSLNGNPLAGRLAATGTDGGETRVILEVDGEKWAETVVRKIESREARR